MTTTDTTTPTTVPPCPPWCTLKPGHDYSGEIPGVEMSRGHAMDVGPVEISAEETQTVDGAIMLYPLSLYLELDGYGHLTAEQARELVPWLIRAADKLDELNNGAK
jgi:hypothetical protein